MSTIKDKSNSILVEKQNKIRPENIKEGIQVFDVTGTYQGEITNNVDENTGITNALVAIANPSVEIENLSGIFGKFLCIEPDNMEDTGCTIIFSFYAKDTTELQKLLGENTSIQKIIQIYIEGRSTPLKPVITFKSNTYITHVTMSVTTSHTYFSNAKITRIVVT